MRFTAQEEYGLRCLLQIVRDPDAFLTTREIARRTGLTPAYVAKLLRILRRTGFVRSRRGVNGGYELARSPSEIDVRDVLFALDGRLHPDRFCGHHGPASNCQGEQPCGLRPLWIRLDKVIDRSLDGITLETLATQAAEPMTGRAS